MKVIRNYNSEFWKLGAIVIASVLLLSSIPLVTATQGSEENTLNDYAIDIVKIDSLGILVLTYQ